MDGTRFVATFVERIVLVSAHVEEYPLPSLDTLKDCLEFLWSDPGTKNRKKCETTTTSVNSDVLLLGNKRAQKTVDEVLDLLNRSFKALHGQSLRHIIVRGDSNGLQ